MESLQGYAGIVIFLSVVAILAIHSIVLPPKWLKDNETLQKNWNKIISCAVILATLTSLASFFLYVQKYNEEYATLSGISSGILSFVAVQSFATDVSMRLVNRWMLRLGSLMSAIAGTWFLFRYTDHQMLLLYALFFVIFSVLICIPIMGESDARAIQLVSLSSIPVLGFGMFSWGIALVAVFVMTYGTYRAFKQKAGIVGLLTKVSIPMVPLIVSPFLIMNFISLFV